MTWLGVYTSVLLVFRWRPRFVDVEHALFRWLTVLRLLPLSVLLVNQQDTCRCRNIKFLQQSHSTHMLQQAASFCLRMPIYWHLCSCRLFSAFLRSMKQEQKQQVVWPKRPGETCSRSLQVRPVNWICTASLSSWCANAKHRAVWLHVLTASMTVCALVQGRDRWGRFQLPGHSSWRITCTGKMLSELILLEHWQVEAEV